MTAATLPFEFADFSEAAPAAVKPDPGEDFSALRTYLETYGRLDIPAPVVAWEDPRPDLTMDCPAWRAVLKRAYVVDGKRGDGAFAALYMARLVGATLVHVEGGGLRVDAPAGLDTAAWQALRTAHLLPNRAAIEQILAAAGR